jgi:hypothetical protein
MANLKLGKLPDRTPVKLTIAISPELNRALSDYARAYEEAYGQEESPAELVPAMLEIFWLATVHSPECEKRRSRGAASRWRRRR